MGIGMSRKQNYYVAIDEKNNEIQLCRHGQSDQAQIKEGNNGYRRLTNDVTPY